MIVAQQQLVTEQCGEYLRAIVRQATMPHLLVQLESRFEPVVERFDALASSSIQPPTDAALVEGEALQAVASARRQARGVGLGEFSLGRVPGIAGT